MGGVVGINVSPAMRHALLVCVVGLLVGGCASRRGEVRKVAPGPAEYYLAVGLNQPVNVPSVVARCAAPMGWKAEPLKKSDRHTHQVWLSPTGRTAYGVIHFDLPLPVGVGIVHWEFLREMQKHEGEATELSRQNDPSLPGMRFVCEGGLYKMRINMIVQGFEGWAIYAGTLRRDEVMPAELELAERARENTLTGLPDDRVAAEAE